MLVHALISKKEKRKEGRKKENTRKWRYSSRLFLTWVQDLINGQLHATVDLPPGNSPRSGTTWTGGYVGHRTCPNGMKKRSLVTAGNRTTIPWKPCPRPSHYTDWATPALVIPYMQCNTPVLLVNVYTHLLRRIVLILKDFTNTKHSLSSSSSSSSALQHWVGLGLFKHKTLVYYNSVHMFCYEIMTKSSNDIRLQ